MSKAFTEVRLNYADKGEYEGYLFFDWDLSGGPELRLFWGDEEWKGIRHSCPHNENEEDSASVLFILRSLINEDKQPLISAVVRGGIAYDVTDYKDFYEQMSAVMGVVVTTPDTDPANMTLKAMEEK